MNNNFCNGIKILDLDPKRNVTGSEYVVIAERGHNYKMAVDQVVSVVINSSTFKTELKNYFDSRIAPIETSITELQEQVTSVSQRITELNNIIGTEFSNQISNLESSTTELNNQLTSLKSKVDNHVADKSNPHEVTSAQVGLGNVDNTSVSDVKAILDEHIGRRDNPHVVTRDQLSLATSDNVVFNKVSAPSGFFKE